jgi:hypothetical protein
MRDITGVDLAKLAQEAFSLSRAQGLGFLHATPDPLSGEEAAALVEPTGRIALSLDYVRGRAVKLTVFRSADGSLSVRDDWYDHSEHQDAELWQRVGITPKPLVPTAS